MHVNVLRIKEYENMPALAVVKNKANQTQSQNLSVERGGPGDLD